MTGLLLGVVAGAVPSVSRPGAVAFVVLFFGILLWNRFGAPRLVAHKLRSQPAVVFPFQASADPSGLQVRSPQLTASVDWSQFKRALLLGGDLDCIGLVLRRGVQCLPNEALLDGGDGVPAAAVGHIQRWIDLRSPSPD